MSTIVRKQMKEVMTLAWSFVKRNGYSLSEALKYALANKKLARELHNRICKFYFQKVDGSIREAFGTLKSSLIPAIDGQDTRKRNDTVQVVL